MKVGESASRKMIITEEAIAMFVTLSGDQNPIHSDEEFARKSIFGGRIAPGLQVASLISAVLANDLPGPGTIYLGQNLQFLQPAFLGDEVEARAEVESIPKDGRAKMTTNCYNQNGELIIKGQALVKFDQEVS